MKCILVGAACAAISLSSACFAQTTSPQTNNSSSGPSSTTSPSQNFAAAEKIKHDLQGAGFTDVNVVAESFVVQAKSKDGNPVVMTIGPRGMSVFEAMNASKSNSGSSSTTGSSSSTNSTDSSTQK